jgi:hypothetical protein
MERLEITDATRWKVIGPQAEHIQGRMIGRRAGCYERLWKHGKMQLCESAEKSLQPIPRNQWKKLIEEGQGNWLHDRCKPVLPPHNQGRTNYCWAHGPVRAFECLAVATGRPVGRLSSASVAVPITGGRNVGGHPEKAILQLRSQGACPLEMWPDDKRSSPDDLPAFNTAALKNRLIRWIDIEGWDMQITCALLRIPVAIGLSWWGHAVCQLDPVIMSDGSIGIGVDNSWGEDWGDYGYGTLDEKHGTADIGAFGPLAQGWQN